MVRWILGASVIHETSMFGKCQEKLLNEYFKKLKLLTVFILQNYSTAVIFCIVTMLCWGSWANTQKLSARSWRFELFYWDYVLGILLFAVILALTLGSNGNAGRSFISDLSQADRGNVFSALIGGTVFNAANILFVAAIGIAGMAVAFPVAIGLALVIGVIVNYSNNPVGNRLFLMGGVALIVVAILLNANAYRKMLSGDRTTSSKGLLLSVVAGILMGFFYKYVAVAMFADFAKPEAGKLSPYTAVCIFSVGIIVSNLLFNTILMKRPFTGMPLSFTDYFKGSFKNHLTGILGGAIWCLGMSFSIIASGKAGPAISYGLGQGATVIAALWGIFIWKEFRAAPKSTSMILNFMLVFYVAGICLLIYAGS
jgi:glucose uptake protein